MKGIGELLGLLIGTAAKSPLITKMAFFAIFLSLLTYAFSFIKAIVAPYVVTNSLMSMAAYFGILDGISLYITIIVSGFGVKQVIAFIRS